MDYETDSNEPEYKKKRYDENFDQIGEFFFESDHVALKGNPDYHNLLKFIALLESQRSQAIRDLDSLRHCHKEALSDPLAFVQKLQKKEPLNLPSRQKVPEFPNINWNKYALSGEGLPPNVNQFRKEKTYSNREEIPSNERNQDLVRGRAFDPSKPASFNQLWSSQEQKKLEELLVLYPPEEVEAHRWGKISQALGTRTPAQVCSRVQKYFIKLSKAGLAIPGRAPSRTLLFQASGSRRTTTNHRLTMMRVTSSFFKHHLPSIYMADSENIEEFPCPSSSPYSTDICTYQQGKSATQSKESDEEEDPLLGKGGLWENPQYQELLYLEKLKEDRTRSQPLAQHIGYKCDRCKCDPIIGIRWHCTDCPPQTAVDFCNDCVDCQEEVGSHRANHQLEPLREATSTRPFLDGDYLHLMGSSGSGCNYLDPNYMPANQS